LAWQPIDDGARAGRSVLLRAGNQMALGRWNGERFVYPATRGRPIEFEPTAYYDPSSRQVGGFHGA
ncbi:hypothetical protein, partial [Enterococcus faecalis]|uniref:hypothetical protein n=1 Tax=Enterococcus faecalis TaxID=1351 RepID=UPI00403F0AB5